MVIPRMILGVAAAAAIAFLARRARSLDSGGAFAATIVGAAAVAAGWNWGALLVVYFASSTALSRLGRAAKERRTSSIIAKGGERDAMQVLANGAVFAIAAIGSIVAPDARWFALGAGSLAASAADTWATEIGTLYGANPRSIITGRTVPAGTSGGVSAVGTVAALAGAALTAIVAKLLYAGAPWLSIFAAGVAGALADSLFGGTVQSRRWCDVCGGETERTTHDCGNPTRRLRGFGWLDNDAVNFLSNGAGGLLAALLAR